MNQSIKRMLVLSAAVTLTTSISTAQYRVNNGNALDASNRSGSGGLNQGGDSRIGRGQYSGVTGNQIVTGNVTAGKHFRGFVPYGDARGFRGTTGSQASDFFIRGSSGTPYGGFGGYNSNANTTRSFIGDSEAIPPPVGYTRTNFGVGGYVPAPAETRYSADLRMGNILNSPTIVLPQLGTTILPGPLDPSTQNTTLLTMSSLYGVRQWNAGNEADQQFVSRYANAFGGEMNAVPLSDLEIGAMRREMQQAAGLTPKPI